MTRATNSTHRTTEPLNQHPKDYGFKYCLKEGTTCTASTYSPEVEGSLSVSEAMMVRDAT